jgi:hypothetical protein
VTQAKSLSPKADALPGGASEPARSGGSGQKGIQPPRRKPIGLAVRVWDCFSGRDDPSANPPCVLRPDRSPTIEFHLIGSAFPMFPARPCHLTLRPNMRAPISESAGAVDGATQKRRVGECAISACRESRAIELPILVGRRRRWTQSSSWLSDGEGSDPVWAMD